MLITHELPAGWVDTGEASRIQPSHVAGMAHVVELEPADIVAIGGRFAGEVAFFATAAAPAGWLICNGQTVSRATYSKLFAAVGELWGAGDGVSTFKVPDLRGEFVRGADLGRGIDAGRAIGSEQGDAIRNISGKIYPHGIGLGSTISAVGGVFSTVVQQGYSVPQAAGGAGSATEIDFSASRVVPTAGENRPRNIAMLPCICTGA